MKTYVVAEVQLHVFLTSVLDVIGQIHDPAALSPVKEPQTPVG